MTQDLSPDGMWAWNGSHWEMTALGESAGVRPGEEPAPLGDWMDGGRAGGISNRWWVIALILGGLIASLGVLVAVGVNDVGGGNNAQGPDEPLTMASTEPSAHGAAAERGAPSAGSMPMSPRPSRLEPRGVAATTTISASGMFEVGSEIQAGLYHSEGSGYWERLTNASRDVDAVIANRNFVGSTYVRIAKSDGYFFTGGESDWVSVDGARKGKPAIAFAGDGMFMVGVDIAPGRYTSAGSGAWQRLRSASGERSAVLAEGRASGKVTVRVRASDQFFNSNGMQAWERVGG